MRQTLDTNMPKTRPHLRTAQEHKQTTCQTPQHAHMTDPQYASTTTDVNPAICRTYELALQPNWGGELADRLVIPCYGVSVV